MKRLQCIGYAVRMADPPSDRSTGRKIQRKKSHRKGYSQMGEKGRRSFDADTGIEDGSKEERKRKKSGVATARNGLKRHRKRALMRRRV
jgi:hypothetical protein